MIAYKGFNLGLICRGYQFTMGRNTTAEANCAHNGFHCAEDPLDCLCYYSDMDRSEYYLVQPGGDIDEDEDDSKIACTELTIIKKLERKEFFLHALAYMVDHPEREWSSNVRQDYGKAQNGYVVVRGTDPIASGKKGDILAFAKEAPEGGKVMTTWMIAEIPASGDDFSFIFSRTKKLELVCRRFDGSLTLEWTENTARHDGDGFVRLSCGSRTGEFDTWSTDLCPDIPQVDGDVSFSANAAELLERINRVAYATLKPGEGGRDASACVEFSGKQIYALDGYRAAWDDGELDFPQPFLAYAEPLRHLKVFGDHQVDFRFSKPWFSMTDGTITIISRTADSEPYHLESAVPRKYLETFSVSPREFLTELKYLKDVIPMTRKPYVYLCGNELLMPVNGRRYSTALAISRTGDTEIGFNLHYLNDALRQFRNEERVTVKISGVYTPVVIEAEGRNDCAMVLPVRAAMDTAA